MEDNYQAFSYSISNVGKEKNGDSFLCELLVEENILLAVVADGVSKQPCDWLASQTACIKLYEFFQQNQQEKEIGKRLQQSILQTNEYILNIEGPCQRMASTLSVVAWPTKEDLCWLINIGDSRVYSSYQGQVELLTKDDAIIFKEKVLAHGGVRVIDKSVLNKVMGMSNLNFSVTEKPFRPGEVLVLATDGFYDSRKSIFSQTIAALSQREDFKGHCQEIVKKFEILRGDDFTTIVIKKSK